MAIQSFNIFTMARMMALALSLFYFTLLQQLRSYQVGQWFVTVHTHGNFIVLLHWEIRSLAPWLDISQPLSWHWAEQPCPIQLMPSTWLGSYKFQFDKSLVWLDRKHFFLLINLFTLFIFIVVSISGYPSGVNFGTVWCQHKGFWLQVLNHLSGKLGTKGGPNFWILRISRYRVNMVVQI